MSSTSSPPVNLPSSTPPSSVSPEPDDDVWGSDRPSQPASPLLDTTVPRHTIMSDAPLVRRQQLTAGYREGVSVGKAQTMQDGFDQGYPLGAEIGIRVGYIRGVMEGIVLSLIKARNSETAEQLRKDFKNITQKLHVQEFLKGVEEEIVSLEQTSRLEMNRGGSSDAAATSRDLFTPTSSTNHTNSNGLSIFNKSAMNYLDKLESGVEALLNDLRTEMQTL